MPVASAPSAIFIMSPHTTVPGATARVLLLSPPFSTLDYSLPEHLPARALFIGQRVAIPLGKSLRVGIIQSFFPGNEHAEAQNFTLKPLLWPLEKEPLLSAGYLDLITQLSQRQTESPGRILGTLLPAGLRSAKIRIRFFEDPVPLDLYPKEMAALSAEKLRSLGELWTQGLAETRQPGLDPLDAEFCSLASDPPWPVRPAAKAQTALLEHLLEHGSLSRRRVLADLGKNAAATLALLAGRGLVHIRPEDAPEAGAQKTKVFCPSDLETPPCFSLTAQQQAAFDALLAATQKQHAETHLLFGVTGSGKTAIYLELAKKVLATGKSVLLLAPEVALALKLKEETARLPLSCLPERQRILFHGYQSPVLREATFRRVSRAADSPFLITGTRSALLLPVENIGLIVLDEEHDSSFKQEEGLHYQAKEVAWYRARQQRALLLLASATPDVKSFYAAKEGLLPLHRLTERLGSGGLPRVRLVPMDAKPSADASLLAPESLKALREVVSKNEQAVILLNRRGYAPLMYCQTCSSIAKCPHCDISLSYHKGRERLICHYCGHCQPYPSPCSLCRGMRFLPMGEGTEKLEESLAAQVPPEARILRLDRDNTRRPGRMEEILAAFGRKEASILVGTQMLSKGHHFPDVTLAIVADADLGLNLPDYRAAERAFQLLLQSAGRSGRGEKAGEVLIQTRNPTHYCWEYVRNADYEGFYERELALRQRYQYPPFIRLALIRISHPVQEENAAQALAALGVFLKENAAKMGLTLLGPAPAPLHLLKGQRRFHCLVKGGDWPPLRALYRAALETSRKTPLKLTLDLDPLHIL